MSMTTNQKATAREIATLRTIVYNLTVRFSKKLTADVRATIPSWQAALAAAQAQEAWQPLLNETQLGVMEAKLSARGF